MSARRPELRRILMAVDTAALSAASIACVVDLAARLEAELVGLFVEDDELLRSAALPVVRRVSFLTGAHEGLDVARTERELRALAAAFERELAAAARRSNVRWSFRVVRGRVTSEVARAAADVDVVVVRRGGRPPSAVRASVLALPAEPHLEAPVLVPFDGSPATAAALAVAARLASDGAGSLEVLLLARTAAEAEDLAARAAALVAGAPVGLACRTVPAIAGAVRDVLRRRPGRLVVLAEAWSGALADDVRALAERLDVPTLTVRSAG